MAAAITPAAIAARYTQRAVLEAARAAGDPEWLVEQRVEAARAFAATPMPTPRLRPWKYTDVTALAIDSFAPAEGRPARFEAALPDGAFAGTLRDALGRDALAARVRDHLGTLVRATEGKFAAANAALWRDGAFVYAPRGRAVAQPVVLHEDAQPDGAEALFPRLLVVAESGSELTLVVRNRSRGGPLLVAGVVEIVAAQDANVRVVLDGRWGAETQEFTTLRSRLGRDARVQVISLGIGGALIKQALEALIEGEGASSSFRGVALGSEDQHFDFVTLQDHIGPRSVSEVDIKSALAGASKSVYYGVTRVEETARGADAHQENRNLLLSGRAKADSDPVLEILTSEVVRCGHGATVGPVDRDALFYLQSRGIAERQALQLLVGGFVRSVLEHVNVAGLGDEVEAAVVEKLETAEL
ncbi:MAG: Fe-S cluster assembly protein SufD [Candidatus Rokubacteria bacterium]|nr:Fe-S cluster assembly protein SufD [Chloroflexota bacterium]MBM4441469.1 Fe-S cluster assembly protein SufD [Candidatus Rokubacteria bacterium]